MLATEDRRFFEHFGIDFLGLTRAMAENVRANSVVQGGSTITQQLAKNLFLTNERTMERKIKEAFLSLWLEANLSKKEILKLYLDRAYMGGGNFGITRRLQFYFDKAGQGSDPGRSGHAGRPLQGADQICAAYQPAGGPRARQRSADQHGAGGLHDRRPGGRAQGASRRPSSSASDTEGPNYFLDWAFEEVKRHRRATSRRAPSSPRPRSISTCSRWPKRQSASHLRQFGKEYNVSEAAMVVIDHDGAVRAMVGGRDYGESQFNRATVSRRQPGSSFKPFVYASAIENFGLDENTRVDRRAGQHRKMVAEKLFGRLCRRDDADDRAGQVLQHHSGEAVPWPRRAARVSAGKKIEETARKMGVVSPLVLNAPMVLGSNGLTVMEMATSYGAFMTGGMKLDSHAVTQMINRPATYSTTTEKTARSPCRALSETTAGVMNRIMAQIPEWGTARRAALDGIRAAGKTGTTSSYRDAWFVGYTGNYVAAVWYGNDDYTVMKNMTGGTVPAMTWQRFMTYAHQNIDLLPVPFIENPLPGGTEEKPDEPATQEMVQGPPALRPKLLSKAAEQTLLDLERKLRDAKPVTANQVVAAGGAQSAVAR